MHYIRLLRLPNLFIIVLTMYLMRYAILAPQLKIMNLALQFGTLHFAMLVIATVCITAAGYVINDYFDTKTDMLNHPDTVTVGKTVPRRLAISIHFGLNIIGVLLGVYISFYIRLPFLSFIFLLIPGILWFYSTTYKRQFLIGNVIVAFLTALVPLMVLLFEVPLLIRNYGRIILQENIDIHSLSQWIGGYTLFAFFLTLIREVVKDIQDFEGDTAFGRSTLPIVLGVQVTRLILDVLIAFVLFALVWIALRFVPDRLSQAFVGALLLIPLVISVVLLHRAEKPKDYKRVSNLLKMIMLAGVLYSLLAWYIFNHNLI